MYNNHSNITSAILSSIFTILFCTSLLSQETNEAAASTNIPDEEVAEKTVNKTGDTAKKKNKGKKVAKHKDYTKELTKLDRKIVIAEQKLETDKLGGELPGDNIAAREMRIEKLKQKRAYLMLPKDSVAALKKPSSAQVLKNIEIKKKPKLTKAEKIKAKEKAKVNRVKAKLQEKQQRAIDSKAKKKEKAEDKAEKLKQKTQKKTEELQSDD